MKSNPEGQLSQPDEKIALTRQQLSELIVASREQGFLLVVLLFSRISRR
jgi:hypothetical protein